MVIIQYLETEKSKVPFKYGAFWYSNVVSKLKVKGLEDLVERLTSMDTLFIANIMLYAHESACSDLKLSPISKDLKDFYSIIDEVGLLKIIQSITVAITDLTGVSAMDESELTNLVEKATKKKQMKGTP